MKKTTVKTLAVALLASLGVACSSGSGDGSNQPKQDMQTPEQIKKAALTKQAQDAGLSEANTQKFVEKFATEEDKSKISSTLENWVINEAKKRDVELENGTGYSDNLSVTDSLEKPANPRFETKNIVGKREYDLKYVNISADIEGTRTQQKNGGQLDSGNVTKYDIAVNGLATKSDAIKTEGTATYTGKAFNALSDQTDKLDTSRSLADLTYTIDFSTKKGSGEIKGHTDQNIYFFTNAFGGVSGSKIILKESDLKEINLNGQAVIGVEGIAEYSGESDLFSASAKGSYNLGLYGPNAEEIGGSVELNDITNGNNKLGFAGKAQ